MISFLRGHEDNWKCPSQGLLTKPIINQHLSILRGKNNEKKRQLLKHLAEAARAHWPELEAGGVTTSICMSFTTDCAEVQEAAALALTTLCRANRAISDMVLAATHPQQAAPVPHAFRLLAHKNAALALAAAELLHALSASAPSEVLEQLLQPSNIGLSGLVTAMRFWSLQSCSAGAPVSCVKLLQVLLLMLHSLVAPADGCTKMPTGLAKALLKVQVMILLLEIVQEHRGRRGAQQAAARADSGEGDCFSGHAAVVKEALGLLRTILLQGPTIRRKFKDADGVQRLLAVIRELNLPWSVKLPAVAALTAAAPFSHVADQIGEHGLDLLAALLQHAVPSGLQDPGVDQLLELMKVVMVGARATGTWLTDHQAIPAFQAVLGALSGVANADAVRGRREAAMAAVQVLFQLSCHWPAETAAIPPGQEGDITTLLFHFIAPASALHSTDIANSARDARLMHIALCALGVIGKNAVRNSWTWSLDQVAQMITLLRTSAPAVLKAVCAPSQAKDEEKRTEAAEAAADEDANDEDEGSVQLPQLAGHAYLGDERVAADFRAAMPAVLQLLAKMISQSTPESRNNLLQLGIVNAVKRFNPWVEVQNQVESVLLLLGHRFGPYRPCTDYSTEELKALLASQGVASDPLVTQGGFDSHMLLVLGAEGSKRRFPEMLELIECKLKGLSTSHVEKVKLIRTCDAFNLFGEIDLMDRKIDGCITGEDFKKYLVHKGITALEAQQDLQHLIFPAAQVQPNEPVSFMQFVKVYPTLHTKLIAYGVSTKANDIGQPAPSPTIGTGAAQPSAGADSAAANAAAANAGAAADEPSIPHWPPKRARDVQTPVIPAAKYGRWEAPQGDDGTPGNTMPRPAVMPRQACSQSSPESAAGESSNPMMEEVHSDGQIHKMHEGEGLIS